MASMPLGAADPRALIVCGPACGHRTFGGYARTLTWCGNGVHVPQHRNGTTSARSGPIRMREEALLTVHPEEEGAGETFNFNAHFG